MAVAIIILILIIILFIVSFYLFRLALSNKTKKDRVLNHNINKTKKTTNEKKKIELNNWFQDLKEDEFIQSDDNLKLYGALIRQKEGKDWIIIIHGFTSNHLQMLKYAKMFYELGFNILLVDLRSHGKSEGKYIGMGVLDSFDIRKWINYLIEKESPLKIGLFGVSMGAATVMTTIGHKLPKEVKFAIEDCGYTNVWDEFSYQLKHLFHLPVFPILYITEVYTKIFAHYNFRDYSAMKSLEKTTVPILMIHGTKDTFVPFKMLEENYKNCNSKKEKLEVENAGHGASESTSPKEYWGTIKKFLKNVEKND